MWYHLGLVMCVTYFDMNCTPPLFLKKKKNSPQGKYKTQGEINKNRIPRVTLLITRKPGQEPLGIC